MGNINIPSQLKTYKKLLNLYEEMLKQEVVQTSLGEDVELSTNDRYNLVIKAFGRSIEFRFSVAFERNQLKGKIESFLLDISDNKPTGSSLFTSTFDSIGNLTKHLPADIKNIDDDGSLSQLAIAALKGLMTDTLGYSD